MEDNLLTQAQIAARCGRSERTIARWRSSPDFPPPVQFTFRARRLLFDASAIERFLRQREDAAS
jgi:predicted DNA-binding transcriptional regulator AlpA